MQHNCKITMVLKILKPKIKIFSLLKKNGERKTVLYCMVGTNNGLCLFYFS